MNELPVIEILLGAIVGMLFVLVITVRRRLPANKDKGKHLTAAEIRQLHRDGKTK